MAGAKFSMAKNSPKVKQFSCQFSVFSCQNLVDRFSPQIAEGFGKKKSPREFCRFLAMALGSSDEVITHTREIKIVAKSYTAIKIEDCGKLIDEYKIISKMLNRLLTSWQKFD